jgi:hypothetical protein
MPKKENKIDVKLVPDATLEPQRIYANFLEVNYTPHDFDLRFCDAGPIRDPDAVSKHEHRIPVVANIVVPVRLVSPIIMALSNQLKSYEEAYGKVDSAPEKEDTAAVSPS